jgi:transposase|tara:strand:+ start:259 stop:1854 length:1596 start_codon:yes stop_codon:yes gene_type:complete
LDRHVRELEDENERLREELRQKDALLTEERKEKEHLREELRQKEALLTEERKEKEAIQKRLERSKEKNKQLKAKMKQLLSSAPLLAASDTRAEAGGVPSSRVFYKRNRGGDEKKPTGGQPGHKGHGRKRPVPNAPPLIVDIEECTDCGTKLGERAEKAERERTITDLPPPEPFIYKVIYRGRWCPTCKKYERGEVPWLPPMKEYGPAVASWVAYQRMLGLSVEKTRESLYGTYGIKMCDATVLSLEKWVADTLRDDYEMLKQEVVKASTVGADETRFRVGGDNGWLWVFDFLIGSLYVVAPTRGRDVPVDVLEGFDGALVRDGWKPYDFVKCKAHQLDFMHVNRWLERAEVRHGVEPRPLVKPEHWKLTRPGKPPGRFLRFVDGVRSILRETITYSERTPTPSLDERRKARSRFEDEMTALLDRTWVDKDVVRISKELRIRLHQLFTFVEYEDVPWHNNASERAIRKGVLARKVSGGRRTWDGAERFQILLSVYATTRKNGSNFLGHVWGRLGIPSESNGIRFDGQDVHKT